MLPHGGLLVLIFLLLAACSRDGNSPGSDSLYDGFKNPPAESRPFVRWWWNGNKVEKEELTREIALLKEKGFGGVEINPIAFPAHAPEIGVESKVWMGDDIVRNAFGRSCMAASMCHLFFNGANA